MGTLTFSPSLYIGMAYIGMAYFFFFFFFESTFRIFGIFGVFRKNGYLGGREI